MKRRLLCTGILSLVLLCACQTGDGEETPIMTPTPGISSSETLVPTDVPKQSVLDVEDFEKLDWTELACYADLKTSLRNSNLQNEGCVTYDEEGGLYFVDRNIGGIFLSDWNGKNRRQLSQDEASTLQVAGEWLYYAPEIGGIKRIHIETGKEEVILEEPCGEFIVSEEKLYVNGTINNQGGFYMMEPDGSNQALLRENNPQLVSYVAGENCWLGIAAHGTDTSWFMEGHLFAYEEGQDKLVYVGQGNWYPLLAGNWLSTFDLKTFSRQVWNLETDKAFDLEVYAQKVASNGTNLYYAEDYGEDAHIYCWNENKTEKILEIPGGKIVEGMFLTQKAVYCLAKVRVDFKTVYQLWYYDLETGEAGMVY